MKNFKRILALVLTFTFVLSMAIVGVSASYQGKWYAAAVDYLDSLSISDIGAFGDDPLSRDEFVTWVAKLESHQIIESAWESMEFVALSTFTDVGDSEHKGAISYSVGREFIEGNGDGTFTPHNTVTFAEACAVIVRLMGYTSLVEGTTWDEKVHNYQYVANTFCGAIDDVFLAESQIYDPDYKLSKGEGAYLLYSIMNGAYWTGVDDGDDLNITSFGVDLGEYFGTAGAAKVKGQYVVASAPLKYTNLTQVFRRYDAYESGATYDTLYDDSKLFQTTGALDTASDIPVILINTFTGDYLYVDPAVFAELVLANDEEAGDALEVVEVGGVVTLTFKRSALAATADEDYLESTDGVTLTINAAYAADTYIGRAEGTPANSIVGWRKAATNIASNSNKPARVSGNTVYWDGDVLVVDGSEYNVVTEYEGVAGEIKVFAPFFVMDSTAKEIVSVVGYAGDKVYAGAYFSDYEKDVLLAHGDYASKFSGNTVTTTFELTSNIPSFVSYLLEVEGAFATATSFGVVSNFIGPDGRIDDNVIDTTYALTLEEAKELILEPAQGESNVVFSDVDRDGFYDIAVVTESSRALYYNGVNNSSYNLGNEYVGGNDTYYELTANRTRYIYDAFGNFVFSGVTLKGNAIGGLVVDQTVSFGGDTFAGGTDNWTLSNTATNKVQLVVTVSNERQSYGGNNDTQLYGASGAHPYKLVDVAELLTGYVFSCADAGDYYRYIIQNADAEAAGEEFSIVFVAKNPADLVDVDVTLDGVTSTVTFAAGKELLAGAVAAPGAALVGRTVKYVADEEGYVWCLVDTAKATVSGFVTGSGTTATQGVYNVTLVTTGKKNTNTVTNAAATTEIMKSRLVYGYTSALFTNSFGIDALFAGEGETDVTVWRFTEAGEMYLLAKGAAQATTTYNFASEDAANAFVAEYGLYRAGSYAVTAADGSYVAAPAAMFAAAEDFVTTGGYDYYTLVATAVQQVADPVVDPGTFYYTQNANGGYDRAEGLNEFDPDTTYYTLAVDDVELDWTQVVPDPDPDTTYYTGDDMAWAVADVTNGFEQGTDYFTIVATEVVGDSNFDAQEVYYTTDGASYFFADIDEFDPDETYYTLDDVNIVVDDFDADEDYFITVDADYLKVAADQFTEEGDSYYVLEGEDYVQNDLPIAIEGVDYFVPDTAGTLTVTRKNFNGLFCHGVSGNAPLTGMFYTDIDGETAPYIKATGYVNGNFGSLFVAGTLFSYADGRYYVKDEYRTYFDVTEFVSEENFDLWGDLYVEEDGDYVVVDDYDEDAEYYAVFFEETVYDAFDLFGYIDWTKALNNNGTYIDYVTESYTGTAVKTYEVKASLTTAWGAGDILEDIIAGKLYNADNFEVADSGTKFTSADLLYVTLVLDGSGYYAIAGVDESAYGTTTVAKTYYYDHNGEKTSTDANGMVNIGNDTRQVFVKTTTYNGSSSNYRTRVRFAQQFDVKAAGAATTWISGGNGWNNAYILKYEKVADTQELLDANAAGQVPGEKNEYKMTIGYNPYYEKTVANDGKVTYTLKWTELAEYSGIIGTTMYKFDPNKAVLIPLYVEGGATQLVNGSEFATKDYTTDTDYYVNEDGLVWKIDSAEAAYDHDLAKGTTTYDDTNKQATGAQATAPANYSSLKTVEVTKTGDTYKLNINKGLDAAPQAVTVDADTQIVVVTPTNTKVVTITVTSAEKLYEAGQTIFATDYQLYGKMLSVIGTVSGSVAAIEIPTASETPVDPGQNPDDPSAETKVCYITVEGLALDVKTGKVFTAVNNAPEAGYYVVAKNGAVKSAIAILDGELSSVSVMGAPIGLDGEYVFLDGANVADTTPWGVEFSTTYHELYIQRTLFQNADAKVSFQYFVVDGVTYVLVNSIEIG